MEYQSVPASDISTSTRNKVAGRRIPAEVCTYIVVGILYSFALLSTANQFSSSSRDYYTDLRHLLYPSWLGHDLVFDNSDAQYRGFRGSLIYLIPMLVIHSTASNVIQTYFGLKFGSFNHSPRLLFSLSFSVLFLACLNGLTGLLKILAILLANYGVSKSASGLKFGPLWFWTFNVFMLISTKHMRGFQWGSMTPHLQLLDNLGNGLSQAWWEPLRFCFLRNISFDMDRWRQTRESDKNERAVLQAHLETCLECKANDLCYNARVETHLPTQDYNLLSYLNFVLYVPLFIAGPIMTFNDFQNQLKHRLASTKDVKSIFLYSLRWVFCFVVMEGFMHSAFVIAVGKSGVWKQNFSGFQVQSMVILNLLHIWLKLLIMWRFFRLWALCDGFDPVENMNRCMMNNQSASGFWRSWHRSFNRWLIRYVYVPLGGGKLYIFNLLITFTFVAVWHDLEFKLLAWGWLICLSIAPEYLALKFFSFKKWESSPFYKHICGFGAVFNIVLMISANFVGFGALSGDAKFLDAILRMFHASPIVLLASFFCWFSIAMTGFAVREQEGASRY